MTTHTTSLSSDAYLARLLAELNKAEIAARLKQARKQAGLRQQQVADLLEVHVNTVQNWERPTMAAVPFNRLGELGRLYRVEVNWILHGDVPITQENMVDLKAHQEELAKTVGLNVELAQRVLVELERIRELLEHSGGSRRAQPKRR